MTTTTVRHNGTPTLGDRWTTYRQTRRTQRAQREARERLERELAAYTSPSEIAELYAIADRPLTPQSPRAARPLRTVIRTRSGRNTSRANSTGRPAAVLAVRCTSSKA